MTPFTIILALSVANNNVYSSANLPSISTSNQLQRYTCENQANNNIDDGTRTIYPVWIRSWNDTHNNIGILETPNFPNRFPLPLRCVWIFDNNVMTNTDDKQKLFIYFTRVIITFYRHCFLYSRHKIEPSFITISFLITHTFYFQYYFYDPQGNNRILTIYEIEEFDKIENLSMNKIRSL